MGDLDPARADSLDDLLSCLRQLHLRADTPSFRVLEDRTKHAKGLLPGTKIERVPLRRSTLSEVLHGHMFPRKGFLLTFVEACGVDLKADQRWEKAWDRLADQDRDQGRETATGQLERELDELRQQLAEAQNRAQAAQALADTVTPESGAIARDSRGEVLVYTLSDLRQQTARVISEIENSGMPAFITRNGRFVAVIRSLTPGQVESRVLAELAREIGKWA
jgi:hypothetical protein